MVIMCLVLLSWLVVVRLVGLELMIVMCLLVWCFGGLGVIYFILKFLLMIVYLIDLILIGVLLIFSI